MGSKEPVQLVLPLQDHVLDELQLFGQEARCRWAGLAG